jgi:hypothetical protein
MSERTFANLNQVRLSAGQTESWTSNDATIDYGFSQFDSEEDTSTGAEREKALELEMAAKQDFEKKLERAQLDVATASNDAKAARTAAAEAAQAMKQAQQHTKNTESYMRQDAANREADVKKEFQAACELAAAKSELAEAKALHEKLLNEAIEKVEKNIKKARESRKNAPPLTDQVKIPASLTFGNIMNAMYSDEMFFIFNKENRRKYRHYRLDRPIGNPIGGGSFTADCEKLESTKITPRWPTSIYVRMVGWGGAQIIGMVKVSYRDITLVRGTDVHQEVDSLTMELEDDEIITAVTIVKERSVNRVEGAKYVRFHTNTGRTASCGKCNKDDEQMKCHAPLREGMIGLKGFYGRHGHIIDRIGLIWGK